ncbi:hypothetical protein RMSM_03274 [Rhodopirellula maiorica SM1]|uniref:Uncharacterized protein n=2 Tax=Novipirellula TaxID=2795426 RepID=M5RWN8_9BACT|nr:hypothetical protein RMSM_03274 [Rhodopirellula maiorica SM1]
MGTVPPAAPATAHNPTHDGWNLKWGRKPQPAPQPSDAVDRHFAGKDPFADDLPVAKSVATSAAPATSPTADPVRPPAATVVASGGVPHQQAASQQAIGAGASTMVVRPVSAVQNQHVQNQPVQNQPANQLQRASAAPDLRSVNAPASASKPVERTTWLTAPQQGGGFSLPPESSGQPREAAPRNTDFFENPFGEGTQGRQAAPRNSGMTPPSQANPRSTNQLRDGSGTLPRSRSLPAPGSKADPQSKLELLPSPQGEPTSPRQSKPAQDGRSLGDFLKEEGSIEPLPSPQDRSDESPESPSDQRGRFENPFGNPDGGRSASSEQDRDRLDQRSGRDEDGVGSFDGVDDLKQTAGISCEDFRQRIASQTIDKLSLDISPPFRPDVISEAEYQKLKTKFDENQSERQWRTVDGRPLASGRLVDLAYEKAVIETAHGTTEELSINRLSEADLAYISDNWGLPKECLIQQVAYTERSWQSTTMTWKASNLCHKPLYFEDVNLERYGHTRGPLWQPVVSSAHFFVNIAVLPYKMGVHAPNECQYALGYYRPGNCAPWIKPPVPISLRGGLTQAAAMTGAFWLIP